MKKIAIAFTIILLVSAAAYFTSKIFYNFSKEPKQSKIAFIPKNSPFMRAAKILEEEGIIESAARFKILASIKGKTNSIKPGEYEFNVPDHPINILDIMVKGTVKKYKITVPEGFNIKEIAVLLDKNGLADKKKFYKLAKNEDFKERLNIKSPTLEGYLYPETYMFDKTMSEKDIIKTMVDRFFKEIGPEILKKGEKFGFDLHQIVTLASMIEKETAVASERTIISSVFHNRLKEKMRLQCDPTVIYGIKNFDGNLTKKHLQTYTPYNTYKVHGLPKGPIANPGIASIRAAVEPDNTFYMYFVSKNDGSHVFSKTYREHVNNVNRYQLRRK